MSAFINPNFVTHSLLEDLPVPHPACPDTLPIKEFLSVLACYYYLALFKCKKPLRIKFFSCGKRPWQMSHFMLLSKPPKPRTAGNYQMPVFVYIFK
jgi:hypothetical protein